MDPSEADKIAFHTPIGNFHYTVMPFRSQECWCDLSKRYTAIFHAMPHSCLEDYVDGIVVKSKEECRHTTDLSEVFTRCKHYFLRMNPEIALLVPLQETS